MNNKTHKNIQEFSKKIAELVRQFNSENDTPIDTIEVDYPYCVVGDPLKGFSIPVVSTSVQLESDNTF